MICCVFNIAPLYREPIYTLLDKELHCDFFIGDKENRPIKTMEYKQLTGFKGVLKNTYIYKNMYWQRGIFSVFNSSYSKYLITGDPFCISNWVLLIYSRLFNKKTYLWTHGWYGRENVLKKIIKKLFFKLSSGMFLYGDIAKKMMIEQGISEEKLIPIYNSLNYDKQILVREILKETSIYEKIFQNNYPVIIFVGRIQKNKKLNQVLQAMRKAFDEGQKMNFILIGKEIDGNNLREIISDLQLNEYVHFYGSCFSEDVLGELIYNASVCVSPGHIGLTAIHSLMYGTPVITHGDFLNQTPEFEVIEDNINGSFFEKNNIIDLKEKILYWIVQKKYNSEIRENCYKRIDDKYNPHFQILKFKEVLGNRFV